jgi:hypothetical protein
METTNEAVADVPADPELSPFGQVLQWIGYDAGQAKVLEEELGDLTTIGSARRTEIADVLKTYSQRTVSAGRITSGLNKTTKMQALAHWVRDFRRVGADVTIAGLTQESFLQALVLAEERAEARATDKESADARAKEASPGKLTTEKEWDKWETRLTNQLSILQGVLEVPLVYVIREEKAVEPVTFATYTEECIAKCPLEGPFFEADARTVHQLIESYTTGENSEVWIKRIRRYQNGRLDMEALRAHYRGEGNQTRRITDAETMRDTLHYKGESAMPFATFLAKVQRMFNLFDQIGEPYLESAKLRFLLDKVQNPDLKHALESVRTGLSINPTAFTFTSAANHLSSLIKPRSKRELSAVTFTGDGTAMENTSNSPIWKNGKIHTGYYSNWRQLSKQDRDAVLAERDKQGKTPSKGANKASKATKTWKKQVKGLKKKIAALKRKVPGGVDDSDDDTTSDDPTNDAGNSFGGRSEKANKKKRNN